MNDDKLMRGVERQVGEFINLGVCLFLLTTSKKITYV
jgi:hypothetical protein